VTQPVIYLLLAAWEITVHVDKHDVGFQAGSVNVILIYLQAIIFSILISKFKNELGFT
jgi:hypothetical protein